MRHGLGGELHHRVAKLRRRLAPQYLRACGRAGVRACGRAGVRACGRASGRAAASGRARWGTRRAGGPWAAGGLDFKPMVHLRQVDRVPRGNVHRHIRAAFRGVVRRAAKQRRQTERATNV
eukprot:scaffold80477_cov71-Phaeocystis_antarctica.AAC.8